MFYDICSGSIQTQSNENLYAAELDYIALCTQISQER